MTQVTEEKLLTSSTDSMMRLTVVQERLSRERPQRKFSIDMLRHYCQHGVIEAYKASTRLYLISEEAYLKFLRRIDTHTLPKWGRKAGTKFKRKQKPKLE